MDDEDKRDTIEKFLDLEPVPVVEGEILPPELQEEKDTSPPAPLNHAQSDYDYSRDKLRELIEAGQALFGEASALASQGQQPEHFNAAAQLFKATVDANEKLLKLSQTHQKITGAGQTATNVTQNNLVVSSSDLLKLMKQAVKDGKQD